MPLRRETSEKPARGARARRARSTTLRSAVFALPALVLASLIGISCATDKDGARGATCDRAGDCADGLFCVQGICGDDLTKVDGGSVSSLLDPAGEAAAIDAAGDGPVDTTPAPDAPPTDTTT